MPSYCVNTKKQENGDNEVHNLNANCIRLPSAANQDPLGWHISCSSAVQEAKQRGYTWANGCFYCARECHTS